MSERIVIDKVEFYITNVCNLTCSGCNRYNNYKFSGWQDWDDYEDIIFRWAEKVNILKPVILGGEPLLNPSINKWIEGLAKAWPDSLSPEVISNGIRIDQTKGLYDACVNTSGFISVSIHSLDHREKLFERINNFLQQPIIMTEDKNDPAGSDYQFRDVNGVKVHVWITDHFNQSNVYEEDGKFKLYNSDPLKAHANCGFVHWKNYHFIKGKFYKCGPVALMPEFDEQYHFDISEEDRKILHAGKGLSLEEFDEHGAEFWKNIDNPIPQCKFCPESYDYHQIKFFDIKPLKI